jgi:putative transposase
MRPSKFSHEQIRQALDHVESGTPAVHVCRELGITQTTFYRWRRKFESANPNEWQVARYLREENRKLKQIIAELVLVNRSAREHRMKLA